MYEELTEPGCKPCPALSPRLYLDVNDGHVVHPGDLVKCAVRLTFTRPLKVTHCWVRLDGEARAMPWDPRDTLAYAGVAAHHLAYVYDKQVVRQQLARETIVIVNSQSDKNKVVNLKPVKDPECMWTQSDECEWTQSVQMRVPSKCPDTWRGNFKQNGSVRYLVTTVLSYKEDDIFGRAGAGREKTLWKEAEVVIRNYINVRDLSLPVLAVQLQSARCEGKAGLAWLSGTIRGELHLPRLALALGDHVPATVTVTNHSPWPVTVSLALIQTFEFKDSIKEDQTTTLTFPKQEKVHRVTLRKVQGGRVVRATERALRVPKHPVFTTPSSTLAPLTSASFNGCHCIAVSFAVRLKLKWLFCSTQCYVPVYIGSERSESNTT